MTLTTFDLSPAEDAHPSSHCLVKPVSSTCRKRFAGVVSAESHKEQKAAGAAGMYQLSPS